MKPAGHHRLLDTLRAGAAVQVFDPQRIIASRDWAALIEALTLLAPGGRHSSWELLEIAGPAVRAELLLASLGEPAVVDASHLVVFAARAGFSPGRGDAEVERLAEPRSTETLIRVRSMNTAERRTWAANQAYRALGHLLTCAALLGIKALPLEDIERCRYDDILGLRGRGLTTVAAVALGYRRDV